MQTEIEFMFDLIYEVILSITNNYVMVFSLILASGALNFLKT